MFEFDTERRRRTDTARLQSVMDRYDARVAALLETTGDGDPLMVDLLQVPVLANASDCDQFWFNLMKSTWEGLQVERARRLSKGMSYQCAECRATATRFDTKFGLPFCDAKQCLSATFAKLHQHGLFNK